MKFNRTYTYAATLSVALLVVLVIQVNRILETAKIREEMFNEKARMVLSKTAETLSADRETCKNLRIFAGREDVRKVDSLFNHYMKFYNIHIAYKFEVKAAPAAEKSEPGLKNFGPGQEAGSPGNRTGGSGYTEPEQPGSYKTCIEEGAGENGLELKLVFPGKKQFILAEMGPMFITSVILILVVLVMFWLTILSLLKEKRISEHTADFLNNMTHEFKTPLTNIGLAGKMITRDPAIAGEEKLKHYAGIILGENEKLRLQVEQVLSMTALEKGEIPLQRTVLDFHRLIRDAVKSFSLQIDNRQGSITLNLDAGVFSVSGDRTHLANAFNNLVDNAIKYSGEKPEISIRTYNTTQNFMVEVSDKGTGIERKYQKKVFGKFFRVPTGDVHDVKGFGLGLAYVKRIVEMHGGTIGLRSEKGDGSTFIITLPNG